MPSFVTRAQMFAKEPESSPAGDTDALLCEEILPSSRLGADDESLVAAAETLLRLANAQGVRGPMMSLLMDEDVEDIISHQPSSLASCAPAPVASFSDAYGVDNGDAGGDDDDHDGCILNGMSIDQMLALSASPPPVADSPSFVSTAASAPVRRVTDCNVATRLAESAPAVANSGAAMPDLSARYKDWRKFGPLTQRHFARALGPDAGYVRKLKVPGRTRYAGADGRQIEIVPGFKPSKNVDAWMVGGEGPFPVFVGAARAGRTVGLVPLRSFADTLLARMPSPDQARRAGVIKFHKGGVMLEVETGRNGEKFVRAVVVSNVLPSRAPPAVYHPDGMSPSQILALARAQA